MRYISQEEGVKLNMTYGDTLLHGAQVKGIQKITYKSINIIFNENNLKA